MPDKTEIAQCVSCGKLFVATHKEKDCPDCVAQEEQKTYLIENAIYHALKQTIEEIVEYTRLPEEDVLAILKRLRYLNESVPGETPCVRCKKNLAQANSEFCLECRLELHEQIGQAAGAVSAKLGEKPYRPTSSMPLNSVMAELEKKRKRTSADSIRPNQLRFK